MGLVTNNAACQVSSHKRVKINAGMKWQNVSLAPEL
jgi:hypothetical protein